MGHFSSEFETRGKMTSCSNVNSQGTRQMPNLDTANGYAERLGRRGG